MSISEARRSPRKSRRLRFQIAYLAAAVSMAANNPSSAGELERVDADSRRAALADLPEAPNFEADGPIGAGLTLESKMSAKLAAERIDLLAGYRPPDPGECGNYEVGPLDAKHLSAKDFWLSLISPYVKIVRFRERQDTRPDVIADMRYGEERMDFSIDRATRRVMIDKFPFKFGFLPNSGRELLEVDKKVGPIRGRMTINDALRIFIDSDDLMIRWHNEPALDPPIHVSVIPLYRETLLADMSGSVCNFGYKELDHLTVTKSRLPSLQDHLASEVEVIDRERIDRSGAANVPDLLRQMSQTAFHRGPGYRATGAQFAELRGLGAQYVKVLINGRPTFGSAADFTEGAFDLNSVPLSAVERVEISPHAASLVHGADAIGGMVNIVLRESDEQIANVRYEGADGGAGVTRGSVVAGIRSEVAMASLVLDYSHTSRLLGHERSRWSDQNFTRYESSDYRSLFSAPPNVSTLDGTNLPGLSSPVAAISVSNTGVPDIRAGDLNRTSLLAWQSIVPDVRRMSVSAIGEKDLASSTFRTEFLLSNKDTSFQYGPEVVQLTLGEHHADNPWGIPVAVSAALSGLPPSTQDVQSQLLRGVVGLSGDLFALTYDTYLTHSSERTTVTSKNEVDPIKLIQGSSGQTSSLNVWSANPGQGDDSVLAPDRATYYANGGSQLTMRLKGKLLDFPVASLSLHAGIDVRREFGEYETWTGKLARDAVSEFAFADLAVGRMLKASLGVRLDDYEDMRPVTSYQYSTTWQPASTVKVRASYNDAFSPPMLIDLFFPRFSVPTSISDPARQEIASITIVTGGNLDLKPAVGRASSLGIEFEGQNGLRGSIDFWRTTLKDRISIVLPQALLANSAAMPDRVVRDPQSAADIAAGRPGRLVGLDITRANFGAMDTCGIDAFVETRFQTAIGSFTPSLNVTYTDQFKYTELPGKYAPVRERAGIASESGTIPQWRLRGALSYEQRRWKANVLARRVSCYQDFNAAFGRLTGRDVCAALALDFNVAKQFGEHVDVMIGGSDILNSSPPFSEVNGPFGFDSSQGSLVGRTLYLGISGTM